MENNLIELEHELIFQTYKRLQIIVNKAVGCRIFDINGNSYLDFLGGIAVNALGHSHPKIIAAAKAQIDRYMHVSNYFYQDSQIKLAEKIREITGFKKIFFTNSGTESIDGAIKLVRKWASDKDKKEIISFQGGFHGRTYGALSLMDKPLYKDGMGPYLDGIKILPFNDIGVLEYKIDENTAAVFLEFIQGEGGVVEADKDFIDEIFRLKAKYNFLVVADEIQTGIGRTGKFCAYEYYNIMPDIITLAKGIGGGMPLGAILANEELSNVFEKGMHGTTYGGNAVACATGLVVLEELQNGLLSKVNSVSLYLHNQLHKLLNEFPKLILELRGKGLMQALVLAFDASKLVNLLLDKRIISNATSGNILRIVPPLIVSEIEVDEFILGVNDCLSNIHN